MAASSPSNAWAFANATNGAADVTVAEHWTGRGWAKPTTFPAWAVVTTAVTSGPRDAWAFGQQITPSSGFAAHYNGSKWTRVSVPLTRSRPAGFPRKNIWAVGSWELGQAPKGASPFTVEHWNGKTWHAVAVPSSSCPRASSCRRRMSWPTGRTTSGRRHPHGGHGRRPRHRPAALERKGVHPGERPLHRQRPASP